MARVHTAKASKDYPNHGIKKGQTYFYWQLYRSPKQMSLERPRPSQLTGSDKLSRTYAACEQLEDSIASADNLETLVDDLNTCAEEIREVADEYRQSKENMPESLQESEIGQLCEENADNLEGFADELEQAASDIEALDVEDYIDEDFLRQLAVDQIEEEFDGEGDFDEDAADQDIQTRFEQLKGQFDSFADLSPEQQAEMLGDAKDFASAPSCPL